MDGQCIQSGRLRNRFPLLQGGFLYLLSFLSCTSVGSSGLANSPCVVIEVEVCDIMYFINHLQESHLFFRTVCGGYLVLSYYDVLRLFCSSFCSL
ncbi:hypothetical protein KC19_12G058200 [Ceratodon purpureus]|uniref:Secreted protein n=1 Tax=Ceratodon purpureus TaxID=3225 RepID=A0A8T0G463_CERPU|nr:hypothetical protein KC19_12G058200 [Ceratodon purpureus]